MSVAPTRQGEAGYTLLELLVVMTIMILAVGAVAGAMGGFHKRSPLEASAQDLEDDLTAASLKAQETGQMQTLTFFAEHSRYSWSGKVRRLPASVKLTATAWARSDATRTVDRLTFYPSGRNSGAQLVLRDDNQQIRLTAHWLTGAIHRER